MTALLYLVCFLLKLSVTFGKLEPEHRFCCDALKIVQFGHRPQECLTVTECDEREERSKEIVRLYGCTDPTKEAESIKFPFATIRTDRSDGWFAMGDPSRTGRKWEWDTARDRPVISKPHGGLLQTFEKDDDSFHDGDQVGPIFEFLGSEPYEVPTFVNLYAETCRDYDQQAVGYQNIPGNQIYVAMDLSQYTECEYVVHFSFARDPYKVTLPYFNERDEQESKDQLEDPTSTSFFDEVTTQGSARGYFAFPYFLIVRMVCQDEGYYGEEFYNVAVSAQNPPVDLLYIPATSRAHFENPIFLSMTSVLINLEQDEEKVMVPDPDPDFDSVLRNRNYVSLTNKDKKICYLNLCQPAYAIPQPFLQIPILQVTIADDRNVAKYERNIYVNPFHARTTSGIGEVYVGRQFETMGVSGPGVNVTSVHPRYFFPKVRVTDLDLDLEQENLHICTVSEAAKLNYEVDIPASFYLEGREDMLDWVVKEMETMKKSLPLTRDDFFLPQYTWGTAPVVAIAGFYQPNLVLLGDPEMSTINLIEWGFNPRTDVDARIFDAKGPCLSSEPFIKVNSKATTPPTVQKPMYAQRQKDELRRYFPGRRAYLPTNYDINSRRAIFEIISLEDRLLLKTTGGIIPLYGNSNATKGVDKILKAPEDEKVRRCFKIWKGLNMALADYDPFLGVTYDYESNDQNTSVSTQHFQEIWYGKYTEAGSPIEWIELGSKEYQDSLTPPVHIDPGITSAETSRNISEAAKICRAVYSQHILPMFPNEQNRTAFRWTQEPDHHNCIIIDGTPKPTAPNVVQLLIEMTFTFYKELDCNPDSPNFRGQCEPFQKAKCLRYHYCMDLVGKANKSGSTKPPPRPDPPKCEVIPKIDCPQIPCYTPPSLTCSTACDCPKCPTITACPPDHCHPPCSVCPEIHLFPRRCDCPDTGEGPCDAAQIKAQCSPCPNSTTDCIKSPFGPCKPGSTLFCPEAILQNRKGPYCPKCMQDFNAALEGDYDYPVKARISNAVNGSNGSLPSDLDLCKQMITGKKVEDYCKFSVQDIRLFVIAQHEVFKPVLDGNSWEIVSIFPKQPCTDSHFERIYNVHSLDESYFGDVRLPVEERKSCFERFVTRPRDELVMVRLTYTRKTNNHLFIYGPKLLHSMDGGATLVLMRDFPQVPSLLNELDYDMVKLLNEHVIMVMAFSNGALYAFLTSKRELWLGTTGSIRQARLRPNYGWSMMHLRLYKNMIGVEEAIPFALLFDSFDKLFELVALRDPEGHIDRILKRPVDIQLVLSHNYFVQDLQNHVNQELMLQYKSNANEDFINATVTKPLKMRSTLYVHYDVKDLSLYCPFSQMKIYQNYSKTLNRRQRFHFNPPRQHLLLGIDHKPSSLIAYSVSTFGMVYEAFLRKDSDEIYSNVRRDPIEKWRIAKTEEAYIGYIRYLKKDPRRSGILVDPREAATRLVDAANASNIGNNWIEKYWINYNQIIRLEIQFFIKNAQFLTKTDFLVQKLSEIQINVDNGNGEIVRLDTERQVIPKSASVKFIAHISLFENNKLKPSYPGFGLVPVPLSFHLIGGFGRCFKMEHWGMVGESLSTTIVAGCPPATDLLFDWNATLHSLQFRSLTDKYGDSSYCGRGEIVCFSSKEAITFNFDVLDLSNQRYIPFDGKFKLQIIGGGKTRNTIKRYNQDQIGAFNIPGKSDISLIWTIVVPDNEKDKVLEKDPETQENVLTAGVTQIKFTCNTLSPCARVAPRLDLQVEFFMLVRISNKGVDKETLCIHEREFVIMLYGFTPSPEIQIVLTLIGCFLLLTVMYIFYVCCRRHRKVWRANKLRILGWWQIIVDTFPRSIKEGKDSVEAHRRRDSIILSLQGHLKIPEIVSKIPESQPEQDEDESMGSSEDKSSQSGESEGSDSSVPRVRARRKGATWTDMVYEQIISQRLLAIVNRNRRMRDYVLNTAPPLVEDFDSLLPGNEESSPSVPTRQEGKKTV